MVHVIRQKTRSGLSQAQPAVKGATVNISARQSAVLFVDSRFSSDGRAHHS